MFKEHGCSMFSGRTRCQRCTHPSLSHRRTQTRTWQGIWLSAVTDVLTVWKSPGMVVLAVLQRFETRCISIHYKHVALIVLYLLSAFCLQPSTNEPCLAAARWRGGGVALQTAQQNMVVLAFMFTWDLIYRPFDVCRTQYMTQRHPSNDLLLSQRESFP